MRTVVVGESRTWKVECKDSHFSLVGQLENRLDKEATVNDDTLDSLRLHKLTKEEARDFLSMLQTELAGAQR